MLHQEPGSVAIRVRVLHTWSVSGISCPIPVPEHIILGTFESHYGPVARLMTECRDPAVAAFESGWLACRKACQHLHISCARGTGRVPGVNCLTNRESLEVGPGAW